MYKSLLIGVNKYEDDTYKTLDNVINDILSIGQVLGSSSMDYEHKLIRGTGCTKDNIIKSLESFFECDSRDTLFLYWAGHGSGDNNGYLITYDTDDMNKEETAISMESIKKYIDDSKAQAIVSMFDCCYSGNLARGQDDFRAKLAKTFTVEGNGKIVITACDDYQKAYELPEKGHGRFTYHILEGIKGEAAGRDGDISVLGLYEYVSKEMKQYTESQTPVFYGNISYPIVLNSVQAARTSEQVQDIIIKKEVNNEIIINDSGMWCLINDKPLKYDEVIENAEQIQVNINNPSPSEIDVIRNLNKSNPWEIQKVIFTFKEFSSLVSIVNVSCKTAENTVYIINMKICEENLRSMTETAVTVNGINFTTKQIAEFRAKRILLGQDISTELMSSGGMLLKVVVANNGSEGLSIERPIFKDILNKIVDKSIEGWKLIRIFMIYYLIRSNTVKQIQKLNLIISADIITKIEFRGIREKIYSNVDPDKIEIEGQPVY